MIKSQDKKHRSQKIKFYSDFQRLRLQKETFYLLQFLHMDCKFVSCCLVYEMKKIKFLFGNKKDEKCWSENLTEVCLHKNYYV